MCQWLLGACRDARGGGGGGPGGGLLVRPEWLVVGEGVVETLVEGTENYQALLLVIHPSNVQT